MSVLAKKLMGTTSGGAEHWIAYLTDASLGAFVARNTVLALGADGDIISNTRNWGTTNKVLTASFDQFGELNWANVATTGASTETNLGLCADASGNSYVAMVGSASTSFDIIKYDSGGSVSAQAASGSWSESGTFQQLGFSGSNIYHSRTDNSGDKHYSETASSISGTPVWERRYYPSISASIWGMAFDASGNVWASGSYNAGPAADKRLLLVGMNGTTGAQVARKEISISGYTWHGQYTGSGRIAINGGNFHLAYRGSIDGTSVDAAGVIKLSSAYAVQWSRIFNYSVRGKLYSGGVLVDSSGNVYSVNRVFNTASDSGIYVTKFNSSGTFVDELFIKCFALTVGDVDIDADDNIVISSDINVTGVGYRPHIIKIPSDYSGLSGTYGDITLSYGTSSAFTITSETASVADFSHPTDTSVGVSFGAGTASNAATSPTVTTSSL